MKKILLLLLCPLIPALSQAQVVINPVPLPKATPMLDTTNVRLEMVYYDLIGNTIERELISEDYPEALTHVTSFPSAEGYNPMGSTNIIPKEPTDKSFSQLRTAYTEPSFPGYPYNTTVRIEIYSPTGPLGFCSGTLIGPDWVVSAGHCVFNPPALNGNVSAIKVVPAYDQGTGEYGEYYAAGYYIPSQWIDNDNLDYDFMLIKLVQPAGNVAGYMGWQSSVNGAEFLDSNSVFYTNGYPAATLFNEPAYDLGSRMWYAYGFFDLEGDGVSTPGNTNTVYHNNRVYKGLSGAGSYINKNGNNYVMAVLSHGYESLGGELRRTGHVRIDPLIGQFITDHTSIEPPPLGGPDIKAPEITVFPSPAEDNIAISGLGQAGTVIIRDLTGKVVLAGATVDAKFNVSTLQTGIYLLEYAVEGQICYARFAKK